MPTEKDEDDLLKYPSVTDTSHSGWISKLKRYPFQVLGNELCRSAKFYDQVVQWEPETNEILLGFFEKQKISVIKSHDIEQIKRLSGANILLLDGNINHSKDVQELLTLLKSGLNRSSRLLAVVYNPYFRFVFTILNGLSLRKGEIPSTFLSRASLQNLAHLSGFEVSRVQPILHFPFKLGFVGPFLNAVMRAIPLLRWSGMMAVITFRPIEEEAQPLSLSIVVPARNESGNIDYLLPRLANLDHLSVQIVFVEGHSKDNTWEKIQDVIQNYQGPFKIEAIQQSGIGKKNAVKEGLERATGDLVTILDADMTMPPEKLIRFYQAYCEGKGDLINGSRMVYPLKSGAMQFLNFWGNSFFAKALSFVTDTTLTDSLCGTKLISRKHYQCISRWCHEFGDFDPFGDFDLLFSAAVLGLGICEVPIQYSARTYGTTNISRFQHGWQLLRMTLIGLFNVKMGRMPKLTKNYSSSVLENEGL